MKNRFSTILKYFHIERSILAIVIYFAAAIAGFLENTKLGIISLSPGALNVFLFSVHFDRSYMNLAVPLIAAIVSGRFLYDELQSGFGKQIILRLGHKKYLFKQLYSTARDAFHAIIISMSVVLLFAFLISPQPSYRLGFVNAGSVFSYVYQKSLILYIILFILNTGLFAAEYALFACGLFVCLNNRYLGYIIPSMFYTFSTYVRGIPIGGISLLPSNTLTFNLTTPIKLFQDHLMVILLGILLCSIGYNKWKQAASF